ncbi:MAG: HAMP domain-containing histidine kinase [Planctomycetes bacterium]|nr:HAMP domain-containing histidine kinase [Planctomycetota bacterium]
MAIVGSSLVRTAQQAQQRAELAAQRDARDLASALRAALRNPAVLTTIPPAEQANVRDGAVVVDNEVGWLQPLPERTPEAVLAGQLLAAQRAEWRDGDQASARRQFAMLLEEPARAAWPALVAGAFHALRDGATELAAARTQALLQACDRPPAAGAEPEFARAAVSTALLCAALTMPRSPQLDAHLIALPTELAAPLWSRLHERGTPAPDLAAAQRATAARRALLLELAAELRELPAQPAVRGRGERLWLWFPADAVGNGTAAAVDIAWLLTLPGLGTSRPTPSAALPPLPDRGQLVLAPAPLPHGADDVIPGLAGVVPEPAPPLPWSQRPGPLLGAAGLLLLVFGLSALALVRGARQQALALRARSEFLTGVTHELKTPLASIRLIADVLQDDDVEPAQQREYFALLGSETARLSTLLENVLDLGRMERGERAYDRRPGDLAAIVRDTVAQFRPLLQQARLAVALHEGCSAAAAVVDRGAIVQVLLNLLDNARKYAAGGGRIDVTTAAANGRFTVAVRDFGPGVPAAEHDAVFAQFRRGRAQQHGAVPGLGLGLFLARTIATAHDGTLVCEAPAQGPGARFVLTLPMLEENA